MRNRFRFIVENQTVNPAALPFQSLPPHITTPINFIIHYTTIPFREIRSNYGRASSMRAVSAQTADSGITAMTGRGFGCHTDSGTKGNLRFFVYRANQPVSGCNTAEEAVSGRGLADAILNDHSEFGRATKGISYSPSGKPPSGPQSDTSIPGKPNGFWLAYIKPPPF